VSAASTLTWLLFLAVHKRTEDGILKVYQIANFDSATTKSIELLPAETKDKMFDLVTKIKSLAVIEEFLAGVS